MSDPGQVVLALPKPGPALKAMLIAIGAMAAVLMVAGPADGSPGAVFSILACGAEPVLHGQLWRLVTSGLLTAPSSPRHLIFTLLGLYFLSPGLEKRWGSQRFTWFIFIAVFMGNLAGVLTDLTLGGRFPHLASGGMFGPGAALSALAIAWALEYPTAEVRLFFFLPVTGRAFLWITLGFAVYGVLQPGGIPEGPIAPFGGILAGLLLSGTPSVVRRAVLFLRLASLRSRGAVPSVSLDRMGPRRPRSGGPSLKVVQGGLEDELKKRKPPKDKRFLN